MSVHHLDLCYWLCVYEVDTCMILRKKVLINVFPLYIHVHCIYSIM